MYRAMLTCNGVQTQVITEGRWVEESLSETGNKDLVVVIPGNPGVPEFYVDFIKEINSKIPTEVPVWLVGHAGHVQPQDNLDVAMPDDSRWNEYYGLAAQLEHKIQFIKTYVPRDAKLHLVGHSIGCWFVLNLLQDEAISKQVAKCYMLFPTVERMAESRNGKYFTNILTRIAPLLLFLAWIFTFFPVVLQVLLVRLFGLFYGIPGKHVKAVIQFINPYVLKRVIRLGKEEMQYVKDRNDSVISQNIKKLWFYYGASDGWAPVRYYKDLKSKHPEVNAEVCKRGFYHSFVLCHDRQMGQIVGDLINESISNTQ